MLLDTSNSTFKVPLKSLMLRLPQPTRLAVAALSLSTAMATECSTLSKGMLFTERIRSPRLQLQNGP